MKDFAIMLSGRTGFFFTHVFMPGALCAAASIQSLDIEKRLIHARDPLPQNPCFRPYAEPRQIDVVVLHYTSAIYWFDADFQSLLSQETKDQIKARGVTPDTIQKHRFDLGLNILIFRAYGVAPHYIIGRSGRVVQLVEDNDMAYHAGVSTMPGEDGRTGANYFSIGIELTSAHPDDDEQIRSGKEPAYTEAQYKALMALMEILVARHPIAKIVGHDEIAPDRKKDPGPLFDWSRVREAGGWRPRVLVEKPGR